MIDVFTEDSFIDTEDGLLSYVYEIAQIKLNEKKRKQSLIIKDSYVHIELEFPKPESYVTTFKNRYNKLLKGIFDYDEYLNNNDVQNTLSGLKLDSEKFWYLLLFIYDYSRCICLFGTNKEEPVKEQLTNLTKMIYENFNDDTVNPILPMKLTLQINGKKKIIIDDSYVIKSLAAYCNDGLNSNKQHTYFIIYKEATESNQVLMCYFANMFLSFFKNHPTKARQKKAETVSYNKKTLISRLIYFTKLSYDKKMLVDDEQLKGYLSQYKKDDVKSTSGIYW